jgi:hypothetical protein
MTKIELIGKIAYESDRIYTSDMGVEDKKPWGELSPEVKKGFLEGITFIAANPQVTAQALHEHWRLHMRNLGWVVAGENEVIDREAKRHPLLIPFNRIPQHLRVKAYLFHAIVTMAVKQIGVQGNVEIPKNQESSVV